MPCERLTLTSTRPQLVLRAEAVRLRVGDARPRLVVRGGDGCERIALRPAAVGLAVRSQTVRLLPRGGIGLGLVLGRRGPPGPTGSSDGQTAVYTYGETLSALVPVVIVDGQAFRASCLDETHRGRVCGITVSAAFAGETGTVRYFGRMTDSAWNWTGPRLFVGPAGTLVETPPSGFAQSIARVEASDAIFVNAESVYERN